MDEPGNKKSPARFHFTLRTMFVVVTMVAAAVWLFMRYAGFPGLFFAVVVLCSGWGVLRGKRAAAAGYLAVFAVAWVALQLFGPYTGLRNRVVWIVGTERLQQWAVEVLDNPPPASEHGIILLDRDTLPEEIRPVAGQYNQVILSGDGKQDHILCLHGGGFYHWAIKVGRPGFAPLPPPKSSTRLPMGSEGIGSRRRRDESANMSKQRQRMAELRRCPWGNSDNYIQYHDTEWGVPIHDDRLLFEFLVLGGAQAGLGWSTILNKRDNYRQAFDNFDPALVAKYGGKKRQTLLSNPGIVRNRLKIDAAIQNAKAFLDVVQEFGSFDKYIWSFVGHQPIQNAWKSMQELPARTPESDAMSADLKRRGFKFVGSTICYAFMQAVGMVNDHVVDCFRHRELAGTRRGKKGG